jgi:hypothetical protein
MITYYCRYGQIGKGVRGISQISKTCPVLRYGVKSSRFPSVMRDAGEEKEAQNHKLKVKNKYSLSPPFIKGDNTRILTKEIELNRQASFPLSKGKQKRISPLPLLSPS